MDDASQARAGRVARPSMLDALGEQGVEQRRLELQRDEKGCNTVAAGSQEMGNLIRVGRSGSLPGTHKIELNIFQAGVGREDDESGISLKCCRVVCVIEDVK